MKKIAFLSSGCQAGFGKPREIIAADPNCCEVHDPKQADILMVNFCAMSSESFDAFDGLVAKILRYKKHNHKLKVIAGGCIEGLAEKKDLSFADVIYHHQEEATVLAAFLEKDEQPALAPFIDAGIASISIAQGCNRRCSFCKVHYLDHMQLTSRPMEEILDLVRQALAQGVKTIALFAENSTQYGRDIGTNLQTLLEQILTLDGLRILDVHGVCLDEVTPKLLAVLKNPKIRTIQLEVQSLNDRIRKNMYLGKTTKEVLPILDALSDKFLVSNFMTGFPGHSIAEFNREMHMITAHHLYFLSLDPYDDTPGVPSHEIYQPLDKSTAMYYYDTFIMTVAKERQRVLERLMRQPSIEASIVSIKHGKVQLYASHYSIEIHAKKASPWHRPGDIVQVKITGLHDNLPGLMKFTMNRAVGKSNSPAMQRLTEAMQYFDMLSKWQLMTVAGEILGSVN